MAAFRGRLRPVPAHHAAGLHRAARRYCARLPGAQVVARLGRGGRDQADGGLIFANVVPLAQVERVRAAVRAGRLRLRGGDGGPGLPGELRAPGGAAPLRDLGVHRLTAARRGRAAARPARRLPLGLPRAAAAVRGHPRSGARGARRQPHHRRRGDGGHRHGAHRAGRDRRARLRREPCSWASSTRPQPPFACGPPGGGARGGVGGGPRAGSMRIWPDRSAAARARRRRAARRRA